MKDFVRIQSDRNIAVTCGLDCQDVTNPDAHVPDRLKINPLWPKVTVLIKQGSHEYPANIVEWNTVKALAKEGVLTIGDFTDTADEETKKSKEELERKIAEIKHASLKDIAGD